MRGPGTATPFGRIIPAGSAVGACIQPYSNWRVYDGEGRTRSRSRFQTLRNVRMVDRVVAVDPVHHVDHVPDGKVVVDRQYVRPGFHC